MANPNSRSDLFQNRTILIIDRSHGRAENYQHLLQQDTGVSCQIVTEQYHGPILALCQSYAVDAILLESHFPDSRGFEVLERLRARMGERCPPIITIDKDDAEVAVQALKAGATDYLVRDKLTPKKLCQALHKAIAPPSDRKQAEAVRRKSEERFRLMTDAVPQIIWVMDSEGRAEFFNKQWSDYTGVPYEPTTAAEVAANFVHPEDAAITMETFNQARRTGSTFAVEHRIRSKEGTYRWFLVRGEPYRDRQTGEIIRWFGVSIDINDRKLAEAALHESKALLQSVIDNVLAGIIVLKSVRDETGEIADFEYQIVSAKAAQIVQRFDLVGQRISEVFPECKISGLFAQYINIIETGEQWESIQNYPCDGSARWIQIAVNKLHDGLVMTFLDITEQKKAEVTVQQMLDGSIAAISILESLRNEEGKIVDFICRGVNKSAEKILNKSIEEIVGKTLLELWPSVKNAFFDAYVKVVETGEPLRFESYYPYEGFNHWFDISGIKNGDGFIMTFLDITAHKKAEREAIRVKDMLAKQATDKYRILFNSMEEGYVLAEVIFDENDQPIDVLYIEANPAAMQIVGRDVNGRRLKEIEPNYEAYWYEIPGRVARTGVSERSELYAEPDQKWYSFYVFKVGEPHERKVALLFSDITERKQAEEALRESEENFRAMFNVSSVGKAQANAEDRRFLRVNPALCAITGYSESELLTMTVDQLNHPEDRDRDRQLYQGLGGGQPGSYQSEKRYVRKDGSIVWVNVIGNVIRDPQGKPLRTVAIIEDISDRKRREANLTFLAEITDEFSRLSTADEIMQAIGVTIGEYLKVTTCSFVDVNEAQDRVTVPYAWNSTGVPSTLGTYRMTEYMTEAFRQACRAGETVVVRDAQTDPRFNGQRHIALSIFAFVIVPFHRNGRWTHYLGISDSRPREWRDDEIELIEEISNRFFPRLERARAEAALRQSEQRFRLMADVVPQIVWITDAQGQVEFLNKQWSDYTGVAYEPTQLAEAVANFVHPDDYPRTMEVFNEAQRNGSVFSVEHRIRSAAGTYRWFLVRAEPYRDEQTGEIVRWFGASVDIHDRKRMEANLAFLAEIMADLASLKTASEIMHVACAKTAAYFNLSRCLLVKIRDVMDEAEVVYDFSADDSASLVGTHPIADFHTEDEVRQLAAGHPLVINDVAALPRAAEAANRFARLGIGALANAPYVSDGQWKFVLTAMQTQPRVWCIHEIELLQELAARVWLRIERARAEAAVRASEAKYRSLFESIDEGFCILQLIFDEEQKPIDFRFLEINPAFEKQNGLKNALGRTIRELVPNLEPLWFEIYGTVALTGEPVRYADWLESMGRWFDVYAFRVGEAHERKVAVLFTNISDRKKDEAFRKQLLEQEQAAREEAERANRIKDEFLSILSHELRSPLTPILGWSKLLQTGKFDEIKTARALGIIERSARLQTQLIDDLLDVARILRGKLSLHEAAVNLVFVIEAALEVVRTAAEAKSISLQIELTDRCFIRGDEGRLQQIIWNLLSNAIKFTPTGGKVNIRLERADGYAQVTITDSGKGISPEFLPYIFESFRQQDTSITRQYGGLGLGLSIVKYLVDAHGGSINANSPGEDQGATFTLQLPLLKNESIHPLTEPLSPIQINLTGIKVLAVDDSEEARDLITHLFAQYQVQVRVVASGAEVLAHLDSFQPDVLVCDIGMPDIDGYTLLQKIRALPPERGGDVPAIALTAYATEDDRRGALARGFQRHIAKPIEPEILAIAVAELVADKYRKVLSPE